MTKKLDQAATKKDVKKLESDIKQLDMRLSKNIFDFKLEFDEYKEENRQMLTEFKGEILEAVSEVMGQFKAMREERIILVDRSNENRKRLDGHEVRIDQLEQAVVVA